MKNSVVSILLILIAFTVLTFQSVAQWVKCGDVYPSLGSDIPKCILVKDNVIIYGAHYGIYRSIDMGKTWMSAGIETNLVEDLEVFKDRIYATSDGFGVFVTQDLGHTWENVSTGLLNNRVFALATLDDALYCGTYKAKGVFRYTLEGPNAGIWVQCSNGLPPGNVWYVAELFAYNDVIYLDGLGHYRSSTYGEDWETIDNFPMSIDYAIGGYAANENYLFAALKSEWDGGIMRSPNAGDEWELCNNGTYDKRYLDIIAHNGVLYLAADTGVYISVNDGDNWYKVREGLPGGGLYQNPVTCLCPYGDTIYAGVYGSGIYKASMTRLLQSIPAGIPETGIFSNLVLSQNNPNPFTAETTIAYQLKGSGPVSLKVYNPDGREIITLVDEIQYPGEYNVKFNPGGHQSKLSGGIYYYWLKQGIYSQTRKMILLD